MKLDQYRGTTASLSGIKANAFRMEMNSKIYSMLTEKLYRDKPGAVVRELSCNAWDAHVEAGNSDVPFEIELPTWLQKTFSIRDYGTGIPHDAFEEIYTNVGASTKDNSNAVIGSYGLGSKVAFTLTDTFLVENWNAGKKSTWVCFKSEGFPQVSQISIIDSIEPSGLKVSFDFKTDSVSAFQSSIVKQLSFFPLKPKITGGDRSSWDSYWPKIPDYTGKKYFYYESTEWIADGIVLMGPVAYPFSKEDLGIARWGDPRGVLFNKPLCIVASLGDVDVPPSRETLEFTDKTKEYIESVLETIKAEYRKSFDADLLTKDTYRSAWMYIQDSNSGLLPYKNEDMLTIGNGKQYSYSELSRRHYSIREYSMLRGTPHLKRRFESRHYLQAQTFKDPGTKFYVDDLGIKGAGHLVDNCHLFPNLRGTHLVKTGIKATAKLPEHKKAAEEVIKVLKDNHDITATLVSDLIGFPVIAPRVKGIKGASVRTDQIYSARNGHGDPYKLRAYKGDCVTDIPDSGYFVEIHGSNIVTSDHSGYSKLRVCLAYLGTKDIPVYFVRSKTVKKLDTTKCQPLDTLYPEVTAFLEKQDTLSGKRRDILGVMPRFILDTLRALPELHRKDDRELRVLLRYQKMVQGIKLTETLGYQFTRHLYEPSSTVNSTAKLDLSRLDIICKRIDKEYQGLSDFQSEHMSYRGSSQSFIKGIKDVLKMIDCNQ